MNNKGFIGLIGLLVAIVIVGFIVYFAFKQNSGQSIGVEQNTQQVANQAGVGTTNQVTVIYGAQSVAQELAQSQNAESQQIENMMSAAH